MLPVDLFYLRPFYRSRANTPQGRWLNLLLSQSFLIPGDRTLSLVTLPYYEDYDLLFCRLYASKGLQAPMMASLLSALTRIGMLALLDI